MNFRALVAEFIGTFALVWVGMLSIHHLGSIEGGLIGIALAHGLAIGILATATMAISGGHLNPAVTLAMLMTKRIKFLDAMGYVSVQLAAGFIAAMLVKNSVGADAAFLGTPQFSESLKSFASGNMPDQYSAMLLEAIATFFLVFAIFGTAVDKRAPKVGGLYIGAAVTMGVLAIGPLTGAALNPARWFGPAIIGDVMERDNAMSLFLAYGIGPIIGALVAALVYQYVMMGRDQVPGLESGSEAA